MTKDFAVVAISGTNGQEITQTLVDLGAWATYSPLANIWFSNAVIVTYPWELYGYVMTNHWIRNVLLPFKEGNTHNFQSWLPCFYKKTNYLSPLEISHEEWGYNVLNAYRHIGTGDPLNGVRSSLIKLIPQNIPVTEIKLEDILNQPKVVLETLASLVEENLTPTVEDNFMTSLNQMHSLMNPYLDALYKLKSTIKIDPSEKLLYHYVNDLGYCGIHPKE